MRPTAADIWSDFTKIHYLDPPTHEEAVKAARKLYRFAMSETWHGTVTTHTGKSHSYVEDSGLNIRVGFERGWPSIIEDLAWSFVHRANANETSVATIRALEVKMVREFLKRKWWLGVLKRGIVVKPKPTKDAARQAKIARLEARRDVWMKKHDRALNAIKKIDRSLNAYQRLKSNS